MFAHDFIEKYRGKIIILEIEYRDGGKETTLPCRTHKVLDDQTVQFKTLDNHYFSIITTNKINVKVLNNKNI